MRTATFLDHSGFLVELDQVALLFDWWRGALPPLPDKPLLVFASHRHEDHFNPEIFALDDDRRPVRFLLGNDLALTQRRRTRWNLSPETAERCQVLAGGETVSPLPGITVEALTSTDEGVAFLVTAGEETVFHAGDLNWWHWAGEDPAWNRDMETNFKRYAEPLRHRRIDLAMLALDSRLGAAEDWGLLYFLELADIRQVLPMHQWGDYAATARFLAAHPAYADTIRTLSETGQRVLL